MDTQVIVERGIPFRVLNPDEDKEFRQYALDNDPLPDDWALYHPTCREVWSERGLAPNSTRLDGGEGTKIMLDQLFKKDEDVKVKGQNLKVRYVTAHEVILTPPKAAKQPKPAKTPAAA